MGKQDKKKILFVMILPPPVHGMSIVCNQIRMSRFINSEFDCHYVNAAGSRSMDEIGRCGWMDLVRKGWRMMMSYGYFIKELLLFRPDVCYFAITCHGKAFIKDSVFVLLGKLFRRKIVIHQHNKGMSACVHGFPYRWLLPLVYRRATVILLSWALYGDISEVVKKEQIRICPNGLS